MWKKIYWFLCPCLPDRKDHVRSDQNLSSTGVYVNEGFQMDSTESTGMVKGLGNSLILSKVFHLLPVLDLYACRLVSHQWRMEASKILQKKSQPVWLNSDDIPVFTKMMKNSSKNNMNPYCRYALNLLETSISQPHGSNLRTDCRTFLEHFRVSLLIIRMFEKDVPFIVSSLKYVGGSLETILFIISKSDSSSLNSTIEFQKQSEISQAKMYKLLSRNEVRLPRLMEARFSINGESAVDPCITAILSSCPVQIVDLKQWHSPLDTIFRYGDFEQTRQLILSTVTNSQLQLLCSKLIKNLSYLELSLAGDVEDSTLFEIFQKTSTTLEFLQASHAGPYSAFYFPHPMHSLKRIILKGWMGPILIDSVVLNCKKLEKFDLENFNPDNIVVHMSPSQNSHRSSPNFSCTHDRLQRLGLLYEGNFSKIPKRKVKGVLKKILPTFPNVRDFYSAAETDDILELILGLISREMDSIFLDFSMEISDASVTGIPLDVLEACRDEVTERLACGCWVLKNPQVYRKHAYIGDLHKLQQLHISIEGGSQMTSLSIHHGISHLKSLKILRLYSKGIRWCLKSLADNLPNLEELYLKSRQLYSDSELSYLMDKRPGLLVEFSPDSGYAYLVQRMSIQG